MTSHRKTPPAGLARLKYGMAFYYKTIAYYKFTWFDIEAKNTLNLTYLGLSLRSLSLQLAKLNTLLK